jgi:hypothetical protein
LTAAWVAVGRGRWGVNPSDRMASPPRTSPTGRPRWSAIPAATLRAVHRPPSGGTVVRVWRSAGDSSGRRPGFVWRRSMIPPGPSAVSRWMIIWTQFTEAPGNVVTAGTRRPPATRHPMGQCLRSTRSRQARERRSSSSVARCGVTVRQRGRADLLRLPLQYPPTVYPKSVSEGQSRKRDWPSGQRTIWMDDRVRADPAACTVRRPPEGLRQTSVTT